MFSWHLSVHNTSEERFENKLFNTFDFQQIMDDEDNDPDLNSFNDHSEAVSSPYYTIDEFSCTSNSLWKIHFLSYRLTLEVWIKTLKNYRNN